MTKRMLIDSTHAEETRVVVLDGNRLEDFDVETSTKQQLKGNIYLAKIVRVEPSLQAAFVEFGGGRHGFLAFGEIHPDYYQIPVADRKRLLEMQEAEAREEEEEEEREAARRERGGDRERGGRRRNEQARSAQPDDSQQDGAQPDEAQPDADADAQPGATHDDDGDAPADAIHQHHGEDDVHPETADEPAAADALAEAGYAAQADPEAASAEPDLSHVAAIAAPVAQDILVAPEEAQAMFPDAGEPTPDAPAEAVAPPVTEAGTERAAELAAEPGPEPTAEDGHIESVVQSAPPETVGGSQEAEDDRDREEQSDRRSTPRFLRNYKIQEVMRRRQILLVQVVKEERGNKGAALTTYISLAGRFSVLMPNSPRGGGISRKITSAADRRRLKEITTELDLPRGMGLIVRTAGANRPKPEIIRDCEYLLNQWDQIRELTMKSMAPTLIYEEASLIKRAIRDVYSRDVDDILVDGEDGWRAARDFMRMLMPTHAKKVQLWKDPQPLFAKAQVESQLDAMLLPNVQLRSGGYLVINQTEALVAIDVNSGRSTRERGIEETALRTNLEAAEEAARQLRLRDLAGLIVIDFIDMESRRNNAAVEKKLKDALKNDRARIQVGSISHFGLLEMSRQRLRPSLTETAFSTCPHCGGSGHVRSTESAALAVLRGIEDEGSKRRAAEIVVYCAGSIAFYILNHKRLRLSEIEERFGLHVSFSPDDSLRAPDMRIERVRAQAPSELPAPISQLPPPEAFEDPDEEIAEPEPPPPVAVARVPDAAPMPSAAPVEAEASADPAADTDDDGPDRPGETAEEGEQRRKRRRRRRRGGRREEGAAAEAGAAEAAADPAPGDEPPVGTDPAAEPGTAPDADADASAEDGERKRRGRRGGRRRRRDAPLAGEEGAEQQADAPAPAEEEPPYQPPHQPYVPPPAPAYRGPTPADPFGGANAFDFFDAVEQAEQARIERPAAPRPVAPPELIDMESLHPAAALPEPTPEEPPAAPPASAPVVIGAEDTPPAEKKRGWWRR